MVELLFFVLFLVERESSCFLFCLGEFFIDFKIVFVFCLFVIGKKLGLLMKIIIIIFI